MDNGQLKMDNYLIIGICVGQSEIKNLETV
jgi:hypothetical protein